MVQVRNLENCQPNGDSIQSVQDNCTLDYRQLMSGQSLRNDTRCDERNGRGNDYIPSLEIVDYGRTTSSDTQQAARLSQVVHSGSLLQELDSAKTGKFDGKISKHDLDIYLRMHPENTPQTRAVQEMREAWDDKHHPSHGAVKLLREELSHERKENKHESKHEYRPENRQVNRPDDRQETRDQSPSRLERPRDERPAMGPERRPEKREETEERKTKVEGLKDLKEAGQVRPGEGYYQAAMRMIETNSHKPTHKETMDLVQALRTANDNKTVLTVRDNLSDLLDKQLPGNQGKVRDHLKRRH